MPLSNRGFPVLATENRTRCGPCSYPGSPNHKVRKKPGVIFSSSLWSLFSFQILRFQTDRMPHPISPVTNLIQENVISPSGHGHRDRG